jgi:hypothetical protein
MNTDNCSNSRRDPSMYGPCAFMADNDREAVSPRSTRWAATPMPTSRASRCGI